MADERKTKQDGSARPTGILRTIAKGLAEEPAYLLVFGICFLTGGGASMAIATGIQQESPYALVAGVVVLIVSLTGALIAINRVHPKGRAAAHPEEAARPSVPAIRDADFASAMSGISKALAFVDDQKDDIFRGLVKAECHRWAAVAGEWSRGTFVTGADSDDVLVRLYRDAESRVFCTSVPEFLPLWKEEIGKAIIAAHEIAYKERGTVATRVFAFNTREEMTDDAISIMKAQDDYNSIVVRVFFFGEVSKHVFPPTISNDFTVIDDGRVIGVTQSFGGRETRAIYYFNDVATANQTKGLMKELIAKSKPLQDVIGQHSAAHPIGNN